jgi:hypothetical protein
MCKINVDKSLLAGYCSLVEQRINKIPLMQVVDEAIEKMAEALAERMIYVGSSGKAKQLENY